MLSSYSIILCIFALVFISTQTVAKVLETKFIATIGSGCSRVSINGKTTEEVVGVINTGEPFKCTQGNITRFLQPFSAYKVVESSNGQWLIGFYSDSNCTNGLSTWSNGCTLSQCCDVSFQLNFKSISGFMVAPEKKEEKKGSGGKKAGIAIGVILGVAAVGGIIAFVIWRRRRNNSEYQPIFKS